MMYFVKEYEQPKDARRCLIDPGALADWDYTYAGIALDCAERFHYDEKNGWGVEFPITIVLLDGDELDDGGNTVLAECKVDRLASPVFEILNVMTFSARKVYPHGQ